MDNAAKFPRSPNTTGDEGERKKKSVGGEKSISTAATTTRKSTNTITVIEDADHMRQMFCMFKAAFPQGNEELERELFPSGVQPYTITTTTTKNLDCATNYPYGKPHVTRESWQINKELLRKTSRCFAPSTRERSLGFRSGCIARTIRRISTYSDVDA